MVFVNVCLRVYIFTCLFFGGRQKEGNERENERKGCFCILMLQLSCACEEMILLCVCVCVFDSLGGGWGEDEWKKKGSGT